MNNRGPFDDPVSVATSIVSDSSVSLTWVNRDAAANTQIFRNGSLIANTSVGATSFTDTGLTAATTYTYLIRHILNSLPSGNTASNTAKPVFAATGGTVIDSGGYRFHIFTSNATFTVTTPGFANTFVAGGGAGGGTDVISGGGGAGGYQEGNTSIAAGVYTMTVGKGGSVGANGSNSIFGSIVARGGGRGGDSEQAGSDGGCGGGPGAATVVGSGGDLGSGNWQSNPPGTGTQGGNGGHDHTNAAGGGGGMGGNGGDATQNNGGNGGPGINRTFAGTTYRLGDGGKGNGLTTAGTRTASDFAGGGDYNQPGQDGIIAVWYPI